MPPAEVGAGAPRLGAGVAGARLGADVAGAGLGSDVAGAGLLGGGVSETRSAGSAAWPQAPSSKHATAEKAIA
jgi:hypothetical protein